MYDGIYYRVDRLDRRNFTWVSKGHFGRERDARARIIHLLNTNRPAAYRVVTVWKYTSQRFPRPLYV